MSEEKSSNDNEGWSEEESSKNKKWSSDNAELCILISKIDFDLSVDDNRNIIRKLKNKGVLKCHPDKNQGNLAAANAETILWNDANEMANDFLDVLNAEDFYLFTTGDASSIISFMVQCGLLDLRNLRDKEAQAELDASNEERNQNAINEKEASRHMETLYEAYDEEYMQQQQSMYMLVYIYVCIYMYLYV
jgi:hypothetical protein